MRHPNPLCICLTLTILATSFIITGCHASEEHPKRAPSGFTGVRGKKSIQQDPSSSMYSNNVHDVIISPPTQHTYYDSKQRNNEIFTDGTSSNGGGSDNTMLDMSSVTNLLNSGDAGSGVVVEKRASPSGFMGMRGKKPYYYTQPWNGIYQPDGLKRAPSGFFGMRGKRDWETVDYNQKRAPSGFFGMRGKKPDFMYGGPVGFVGMRGKKYVDDDDEGDDLSVMEKRAPSGFFGVRGKKQPGRSGFFGMRGKKYPYEFRGKFVGVRGKKMYNNDNEAPFYNEDFQRFGDNLDINQLMLLLTEQNGGYGDGLMMDSPPTTYYDSNNDVQQ